MAGRRLPDSQRRVPLAVLISPATRKRLWTISAHADRTWSLGSIIDAALAMAETDLMAAAGERQICIVALSPKTEQNLGLNTDP